MEVQTNHSSSSEEEEIVVDGTETAGFLASQNEKRKNSCTGGGGGGGSLSQIKIIPSSIILLTGEKNGEKEKMISHYIEGGTENELGESVDSCDDESTKNNNKKTSGPVAKQLTGWKRYLGISLGIFSSLVFSLGILIVKLLGDSKSHYHPFTVALWRFAGGVMIPSIPAILYTSVVQKKKVFQPILPLCQPDKFKMFLILFFRAFAGCGAVIFHYYSMRFMCMSDATVIAFATPVFVTFLAHFFLSEQCGIVNVLSGLVTLLGVMVITRPPFLTGEEEIDTDLMIGAALALGSMTFASFVFLTLRVLKGINYSVVTLFFGMYGTTECAILSAVIGVFQFPQSNWEWFLASVLACITFVGQVCTTLALKYEEAGVVALTRCFDVVFSFLWQFVFLSVIPGVFSFIGSFIVLSGVFLIVLRKYVQNLPLDHPTRQILCCILK